MRSYVVRSGDYLLQLAHQHGVDADALWNHPRNQSLREARPDPLQLAPGDVLHIPDSAEPSALSIEPHTTNRFRAAAPTVEVHYTLHEGSSPVPDEPYEVHGARANVVRGRTDGEGRLHVRVPVTVRRIDLRFPEMRLSVPLLIGGIDPVSTASGARQRLASLGAYGWTRPPRSSDDGPDAERDEAAIRVFQQRYGLPLTGELDQATRDALERAHDQGEARPNAGGSTS